LGGAPVYLFFFLQAEDGIRDPLVTGVQTCALPISPLSCSSSSSRCRDSWRLWSADSSSVFFAPSSARAWASRAVISLNAAPSSRSEERRVGKEWRSGWWPWG